MKSQSSHRWVLFLKEPSGRKKPWLLDSLLINPNNLVHFYRWQAEAERKRCAAPDIWGIARINITLEPTTVIQ